MSRFREQLTAIKERVAKAAQTHHERIARYTVPALRLLFWMALLKGIFHLGRMIYYELQSPLHFDALINVWVARGLLNGLTPYVDLFETKPFGIFLIMAVFLLTSFKLATALNIVSFASYPLLNRRNVLIGILLALYVETRGAFMQTEVFGAFFSTLYVLTLGNTWLSTLFIGLSVGMKEPFLFVNLACVILLRKNLMRCFVWPLLIATVIGVLLTVALDIPYFTEYLPVIRDRVENADPFWIRGFLWTRLVYNLNIFAPLFGLLVAFLWLPRRWIAAAFGGLWMIHTYALLSIVRLAGWNADPFFLLLGLAWVAVGLVTVWNCWRDRELARRLAALYLVTLAVATGGYYVDKHFVAAVPLYFTLLCLRRPPSVEKAVSVLAIVCLLLYWPSADHLGFLKQPDSFANPAYIEEFDQMMEDCGLTRFVGDVRYFAFSKYSAIGPMPMVMDFLPRDHELYRRTEENVRNAELYIARVGNEFPFARREDFPFTRPCAREIEGFEVRFRTPD